MADLRRAPGTRPPLSPKISSFSCNFWEKFGKNWSNSRLAHPLWKILDPPLFCSTNWSTNSAKITSKLMIIRTRTYLHLPCPSCSLPASCLVSVVKSKGGLHTISSQPIDSWLARKSIYQLCNKAV